jgi:hypothetical protein
LRPAEFAIGIVAEMETYLAIDGSEVLIIQLKDCRGSGAGVAYRQNSEQRQ